MLLLKRFFLLLFLFAYAYGNGQSLQPTAVPLVIRMGAYSTPQQALDFAANQAALGSLKQFAMAAYGEKRFLLQALSLYHVAVAQPAGSGAFGLQVSYSGNADYNISKTGIAYGRNMGTHVGIGVQFNYWNQHIRGYGHAAQVTVETGLLVQVSEAFHIGIQLCNPAGVVLNKSDQKLPGAFSIGAGYQPSPAVALVAEVVKTVKRPAAVQAAIKYRFAAQVWAKAGINSNTAAFFIATGFRLRGFNIEFIGSVQPQLGLSPALLTYNTMDK